MYHLWAMDRQSLGRRAILSGGAAATVGAFLYNADFACAGPRPSLVAKPPAGFVPMNAPGKVIRVDKANSLQQNGLWPTQEAATVMLQRIMEELTGKSDLGEAFGRFVHKDDLVAIKPNGLAGKDGATMASNKELILAITKGVIAAGVPAKNVMIYEQFPKFLKGTRVITADGALDAAFPAGVMTNIHKNEDATMDGIQVGGIETKFVRAFTDATCVINVSQLKDHSICGFTGTMKNITHGSIINPHAYHAHNASPQIAQLYAQDIVKSRVRLHITDGFKLIYDEGPQDKNKKRRIPHEALYASTDPVAMDVVGWQVIEAIRKENKLPTLKADGRHPTYIHAAADLGLGIADESKIRLRQVKV